MSSFVDFEKHCHDITVAVAAAPRRTLVDVLVKPVNSYFSSVKTTIKLWYFSCFADTYLELNLEIT